MHGQHSLQCVHVSGSQEVTGLAKPALLLPTPGGQPLALPGQHRPPPGGHASLSPLPLNLPFHVAVIAVALLTLTALETTILQLVEQAGLHPSPPPVTQQKLQPLEQTSLQRAGRAVAALGAGPPTRDLQAWHHPQEALNKAHK